MIKRIFRKLLKSETEKDYRLNRGLIVGENTVIYSWEGLDANFPWLITIGNNTVISTNVQILAHDASTNMVGCHTKIGRVTIGNNCFIGAKTTVLCNTVIGDNVIIGAGSVVTSNLESNFVYAGNPARKICTFEEYKAKHEALLASRPYFANIHKWNEWHNSTEEERQKMKDMLSDGCGYI